jgi:hypothetical protein
VNLTEFAFNLLVKIQQIIDDEIGVQKFSLKEKKLNIGGTKEDLGMFVLKLHFPFSLTCKEIFTWNFSTIGSGM